MLLSYPVEEGCTWLVLAGNCRVAATALRVVVGVWSTTALWRSSRMIGDCARYHLPSRASGR